MGMAKNKNRQNIMVAPDGKEKLNLSRTLAHKQDRKELECNPVGHQLAGLE